MDKNIEAEITRILEKLHQIIKSSDISIEGEWCQLTFVLENQLFPLIDEIARSLEKEESPEKILSQHYLYRNCYKITFKVLNYGRARLADELNRIYTKGPYTGRPSSEIGRFGIDHKKLLDLRGGLESPESTETMHPGGGISSYIINN